MACNIIRNENGKLVNVTAENGKNSKLFRDIVKLGYDKETALKKWANTYTPTFKQWFGEGVVDSNGEPRISIIDDQPVFTADDNTTKHATENLGTYLSKKDPSPLLDSIKRRFDLVKTDGTVKNIPLSRDVYRIQETIEKQYPGVRAFILKDVGGDYIKLDITPHLDVDNIYHQAQANQMLERDAQVDRAMNQFFRSLGIRLREVDNIRNSKGEAVNAVALADMVNKIVQVVSNKAGIDTLPEEAAHFMVELLRVEGSPLFQAMMNNITSYAVYNEVVESDVYQDLYKGDIDKLKQEAIGKLIAKHIINNIKGEPVVRIVRAKTWFDRVLDFIRQIFGQVNTDPFAEASLLALNDTINDYIDTERGIGNIEGEYYQVEPTKRNEPKDVTKETIEKLDQENANWGTESMSLEEAGLKQPWFVDEGNETERYVGKKNGPYAGKFLKGRVSDEVKKHFHKINRGKIRDLSGKEKQLRLDNNEMRKMTGTMGHKVLQDLVELYVNKKGNRQQILNNSLFTAAQFQVLENGVKDIISKIRAQQKAIDPEGKVVIRTEQMTINRAEDTGGSIDLMALFSDNSASIYDYKFISPSKYSGYVDKMTNRIVEDPHSVKMQTYDMQISQYKNHLLDNYGVSQVRQSRIIPIHIRFKTTNDGKITNQISVVQMGTKYSEFLEQLPVAEEMTNFDDVNKIIRKLLTRKELVDRQLQTKKYKAGNTFESLKARQAQITKQLRVLQIDQDVAYIVKSLKNDIETINKRLGENIDVLKDGTPNPNYLSDLDLNELLKDLTFYQSIVELHDYVDYMKNTNKEKYEEYRVLRDRLAGFLAQTITQVEGKILERINDKAMKRGVQGIKSFNLDVDWMTSNFVNLSKQNNPYLRNLWEIMDELNFTKRKIVKNKAEEIQRVQDAFVGNRGIKAFDDILNEDGSFKSKFSKEFYSERSKALQSGNYSWFSLESGNVVVDEEYYNKKYKEFRAGKLKALQAKFKDNQAAINREIKKWELAHDVKKHMNTAALSKGGQYFLRPAEKWISEDYRKIQNTPEIKAFYDLYMKTIREVEEMYGERLGPNFTAEVHKGFVESAAVNGTISEGIDSGIEHLQVREHDLTFGIRDENTGKLVKEIPKLYIRPIRDKNGNIDPSLKTRDLGKGLLLLYNAAVDYQLKNEVLPEIQGMEAILNSKKAAEVESVDSFGNILQNAKNVYKRYSEQPQNLAKVYQKFIDAYIYGTNLDAKDIKVGSKVVSLSSQKSILGLKNLHSITQLGLKTPVAFGAFIAGMVGLQYEASKGSFITNKNLNKARAALIKADPKMRALVEHLEYYQKDDAESRAQRLSAQYSVRHMTNDKWFAFLSTADRGIDAIAIYATALNMGIDENGNVKRLDFLPEGSKNIVELMELKENPLWEGTMTNVSNKAVDRYEVNIEGLSDQGQRKLRNVGREISNKVKGTMSAEDKVLYNSNFFMRLMMHYKSWLPGVALARFGKAKYNNILETFDEGTWVSAFGNMGVSKDMTAPEALDTEIHLLEYVKAIGLDLVKTGVDVVTFGYFDLSKPKEDLARAKFDLWATNNANNPQFADKLKDKEGREELFQDFLRMKQGNIKAFLTELRASLAFFLLLAAMGGDDDKDGKTDIRATYLGRKFHNIMERASRETRVFTNPKGFFEAGRATGIPLLNLGRQLADLAGNTIDETRDIIIGEEPYTERDRAERFYYTFKLVPGLNAFTKAIEFFPQQKYERY